MLCLEARAGGGGECFQAVSPNVLAKRNVLVLQIPISLGYGVDPPQEGHRLEMMLDPLSPGRYPAAAVAEEPQTCLELRRAETYQW